VKKTRVVLVSLLLPCVALIAALAAGCGEKTTATTVALETTTEAPTTTTEAPEGFAALINPDKTAADLADTPTISYGETRRSNASDQLRAEYKAVTTHSDLIWVGEHNIAPNPNSLDGNEFNDILISMTAKGIDPDAGAWGPFGNGFGSSWGTAERNAQTGKLGITSVGGVAMEITDHPVISIPDSEAGDFYLEGQDPRSGELFYVRIVMGGEYGDPTILNCHDISTGDYSDYAVGNIGAPGDNTPLYKDRRNHYASRLTDEQLAEFFAPGRVIYILAKGDGKSDFFPKKWAADGNNILVTRLAIILGNGPSALKINAMFE
jgi:hypothetical protein